MEALIGRCFRGICPCGGRIKTAEWETKTTFKGRSTCKSCGRTELVEVKKGNDNEELCTEKL